MKFLVDLFNGKVEANDLDKHQVNSIIHRKQSKQQQPKQRQPSPVQHHQSQQSTLSQRESHTKPA